MVIRRKFPQIYELEHRKHGRYWMVSARQKRWGLKKRKFFTEKESAIKYAQDIEEQIRKFGAQSEVPKEKILLANRYQGLTEKLANFGQTPEDAVNHYVQQLGNELVKQAKPFIRDLAEQWKTFKLADSTLSQKTVIEIRSYARFIRKQWGDLKAHEIKRNQIDLLIKKLNITNNTRRKYLRYIRMFFSWVKNEGHIEKNPTDGIKYKSDDFNGDFYTPEDTKRLLRHVVENEKDLIGYYALMTFAGLRPSEAERVQWQDFNSKTSQLYVRKGKTNARYINLEPVTLEWIKFHRENTIHDAPFVQRKALENRNKAIRQAVFNGRWVQDGLRHGFATYFKAHCNNIALVADRMGNSIGIVKRNYARTVPKDECDAFWSLTPATVMAN